MNELASSVRSFYVQVKNPSEAKLFSPIFLATDLLSRKHILSHEVFDLLQDSLSFQCLPEQSTVCGAGDRPGKDTCHALKSQRKQLDTKFRLLLD